MCSSKLLTQAFRHFVQHNAFMYLAHFWFEDSQEASVYTPIFSNQKTHSLLKYTECPKFSDVQSYPHLPVTTMTKASVVGKVK